MSKFKIINLVDKLFISCSIFLIIYAWINFYLRNLWVTFILSIIFTSASLFVFFYTINRKNNKKLISAKEKEKINNNFFTFQLTPLKQKLELLKNILSNDYTTSIKNKTIFYTKNNTVHQIIFATHIEIITTNNLINLLDEHMENNSDVIEIICNNIDPKVNRNLFTNKKIEFITKEKLHKEFFLKYNIYPDSSKINLTNNKLKFTDILKNLFAAKKAKGYFFSGAILIFSSIILPYHFYYLIVGSTLLLFSLICKLMPLIKD